MVKMDLDTFLEESEKFESYPNTMHDYGVTLQDIKRMEENPDKYARFVMYLLNKKYAVEDDHVFENEDALSVPDARFWLNEFIKENIEFC